ncbi:MAG: AAA family ATPase [Candidatus Eremiobacteraeota bacterium]|nr:AAA family ATPase [Candidatus Eremiobacteraeota bacterium]
MPIFLSEKSENIKQRAEQLSYRLGHYYLGCEHIFLSVLDTEDWLTGELAREGIDAEDIREEILLITGPGDEEPLWEGIITTPRLQKTLKLAEREAEKQKSVRVEPNHLVSAICLEGKSVAARTLAEKGIELPSFRQTLLDIDSSSAKSEKAQTPRTYPPPGIPYGYAAYMQGKKKETEKDLKDKEGGKEKKKDKKTKTPTLDKLGRDLVELAIEGDVDPIVGRKDEIRRVIQTLTKKMKNNPIIIGEAGVGKTAVVYGLAQRIADGRVPEAIKGKKIIEIGMAGIIAGTKHRGEFEERMQKILKELTANPEIILFIDEIHTIMGAGDSRSGVDAGNMLKPHLARGGITIIGATTTDEYRKNIEKDPALERRFQPIFVDEPSEEATLEILKGLQGRYEKHHGVKFSPKALITAVKMSVRYIPDRNLPDKAIDLLDEAAARYTMNFLSSISDEEGMEKMREEAGKEVTENDIAEVVSLWTGVPASSITKDESEKLLHMEDAIRERVVGQDEALHIVSQTVRMVRMGLSSPNRPSGVFLFLGPTGVGKTELAKALAEFLFSSEKDMIRLDMSEYMERHAMSRMIGSPPGYIGHDEEGQLTKQVRTRPYSVVLLDEVEKAHPDVFDLFLSVFDDGRLTDSKGRTVNFTNTIIIMTSNIGTSNIDLEGKIHIPDTTDPAIREKVMQELRQHFRPEFLNRIDEIIIFNPLCKSAMVEIIKINLDTLIKHLYDQREINLVVDEDAINYLLGVGYDPAYGARPLKRAIQNHLSKPLARAMLEQGIEAGDTVMVSSDGNRLIFSSDGEMLLIAGTKDGMKSTPSPDFDTEGDEKIPGESPPPTEIEPLKPPGIGSKKLTKEKGKQIRDTEKHPRAKQADKKARPIPRKKRPSSSKPPGDMKKPPHRERSAGLKRIPFDPLQKKDDSKKPDVSKMAGEKAKSRYPTPKKPKLKQRDKHQDIQDIMPMKGPMTGPHGAPGDIDEHDLEDTKPKYKK